MNKQELIEKFKARRTIIGNFQGYGVYWEDIKEIFEQLDEPGKVKIPQFVADIIEEYKERNAPIIDIFTEKYSDDQYNTWLIQSLNAYDRAARAWLDGYEVEKEKLYRVKMLGLYEKECYLKKAPEREAGGLVAKPMMVLTNTAEKN